MLSLLRRDPLAIVAHAQGELIAALVGFEQNTPAFAAVFDGVGDQIIVDDAHQGRVGVHDQLVRDAIVHDDAAILHLPLQRLQRWPDDCLLQLERPFRGDELPLFQPREVQIVAHHVLEIVQALRHRFQALLLRRVQLTEIAIFDGVQPHDRGGERIFQLMGDESQHLDVVAIGGLQLLAEGRELLFVALQFVALRLQPLAHLVERARQVADLVGAHDLHAGG